MNLTWNSTVFDAPVNLRLQRDLKYLVLSDVHLGHRTTTTKENIHSLDHYFEDFQPTSAYSQLDLIFIAGDLFDRSLVFSNDEVSLILGFLHRLCDFCKRHQIKLRVLEGTPSHDNYQSRIFNFIKTRYDDSLDLKYVETLHIETIEDLGLSVLYVPDEWVGSTQKTEEQVSVLLQEHGIEQVDIAIMHGMFTYQVPEMSNNSLKHRETFYLDKVRYFINIGHVHIYSTFERIIAQGSTNRLSHGDESPKGAVMCYLSKSGGIGHVFIENTLAKIYKTIHVKSNDIHAAMKQVAKVVDKLTNNSHVRIKAKAGHPILQGIKTLGTMYPFIIFTKLTEEDDEGKLKMELEKVALSDEYKPISLTKDNIIPLLMSEIITKYNLDNKQLELLEAHLNKIR